MMETQDLTLSSERIGRTKIPVGQLLRYHRRRLGMSKKEMAAELGLSHGRVSNIENGGAELCETSRTCKAIVALNRIPKADLSKCPNLLMFFKRYCNKYDFKTKDLAQEIGLHDYIISGFLSEERKFSVKKLKSCLENMRLSKEERVRLKEIYFEINGIEGE